MATTPSSSLTTTTVYARFASEGAHVTTLAGNSKPGKVDSEGASVRFNATCAVVLDERG